MARALQNLALLCASAGCVLLCAELALSLASSGRLHTPNLHSASYDDYGRVPGLWEPSQDLTSFQHPKLPHRIRINSLGLRGPETTLEPRGPRVLCIGDSFTFGDFVDDEQTLPARLAALLGAGVEVLNGGVGGTTVVDQRVFLEHMLALDPDVVLLTFSENDLTDLFTDPPIHAQLAHNRELKSGAFAPIYAAVRDTTLFNLLLRAHSVHRTWAAGSADRDRSATGEAEVPPHLRPVEPELLERYASAVVGIRDLLAARGSDFAFATYPSHLTLLGKSRNVGAPVLAALRARGIEGLDLTPALRESGLSLEELYLLPWDGHPAPAGYATVAPVLAEPLRARLASRALERGRDLAAAGPRT
jgi:lysophospholipase L1-like esterase